MFIISNFVFFIHRCLAQTPFSNEKMNVDLSSFLKTGEDEEESDSDSDEEEDKTKARV